MQSLNQKTKNKPCIVSVEELPLANVKGSRGVAALAAVRSLSDDGRVADDEQGPLSLEFVAPATPLREVIKPGPLSHKKKRMTGIEHRGPLSDEDNDSDVSAVSTATTASMSSTTSGAKRKRGRPPTTGEYVGRSAAIDELARKERELMMLQAEREVAQIASEARITRAMGLSDSAVTTEDADMEAHASKTGKVARLEEEEARAQGLRALQSRVLAEVKVVAAVATKSSNLKGTYVRALKDAAHSISGAMEIIASTTRDKEVERLERENGELRQELDSIKKEVQNLRETVGELRRDVRPRTLFTPSTSSPSNMDVCDEGDPPPPEPQLHRVGEARLSPTMERTEGQLSGDAMDKLARAVISQVGNMISARFAAIEGRLLPEQRMRPPLSVDKTRGQKQQPQQQQQPRQQQQQLMGKSYGAAVAAGSRNKATTMAGSGKRGGGQPVKVPAELKKTEGNAPPSCPSKPAGDNEGWIRVEGRKEKRKKGKKKKAVDNGKTGVVPAATATLSSAGEATKRKGKKIKIRTPRAAAVILTPATEGLTRAEIMMEARSKVRLEDLGITHVRPKIAATGAVILEVPGENSAERADLLAERLRTALVDKEVRISRPVKLAELRVGGFDESVNGEELATAMASAGGCAAADVRVGSIRRGPTGLGSVWIKCPATAAKKVMDTGRIMVGWVAARVEVLSPRPLQCYRCLEKGHTRARCTAPVDRGDRCYRCGLAGHTASKCDAKPECPLCKDLGRSAGHRLGSAACAPPRRRRGLAGASASTTETTALEGTGSGGTGEGESSRARAPPLMSDPQSVPKLRRTPRTVSSRTATAVSQMETEMENEGEGVAPTFSLPPTPNDNTEEASEEAMAVDQ